jgi:MFS family permease
MSVKMNKQQIEEGHPYHLLRKENFAIAMAYLSVGIVTSLISTPLNVYLVEVLNAEPQMQNTIGILQTLPWSLKLLFGFLSDSCPIRGMHRKPYLTIGALVYSFAYMGYAWYGKDDVVVLAGCIFLATLGLIQMDVMADTMCVQRSKLEPEEEKGQLQASCYSIRFAGGLIGAVLGATLCNRQQWGWGLTFNQVSMVICLVPLLLVTPCLYK